MWCHAPVLTDLSNGSTTLQCIGMTTPGGDTRNYRLAGIDMLRGLVVVIMALDHVRDNVMAGALQDPLTDPRVGTALFFTRWITHFCAPVFVFLAGTSAGLMSTRKTPRALGWFLLTRGLWLVAVEVFLISTALTFAPLGLPQFDGRTLVVMQVIWAIGASMIALAAAQFIGRQACFILGAVVVVGHNLLDPIWPAATNPFESAPLWHVLQVPAAYVAGPFHLYFAYPLLAWVGVMLLGFGASTMFEGSGAQRGRRLLMWGMFATTAFILVRLTGLYGDPNPWSLQPGAVATLRDILNTTKYPPSLLFLLMTLGPSAILLAQADSVPEAIRSPLIAYGRAPFAFYVAHLYVIHLVAVALGVNQGFPVRDFFTIMLFFPMGYGLSLPGVYVVWILVVVSLYPLCRWVTAVKSRRRDWWLSYL
jgi:uncharacterized membrane protein